MAHGSGEAPRMETKRKFDEDPRNWDEGNAGVPDREAPGPSCSNVRPPLTDTTQPVENVANCSSEMCKRSRMEAAGKGQMNPVRPYADNNFQWFNGGPAAKTLPLHREHGIQFYHGGGSNRPREIDVPNVKASAGGAAAVGRSDFGWNMRHDNVDMSLNLTEEIVRVLHQVNTIVQEHSLYIVRVLHQF